MHHRIAHAEDAVELASLNLRLIQDEGHRNAMSVGQLEDRMRGWLASGYEAVLIEDGAAVVGYALFRREPEHVYLRQFFVLPTCRRQGVGRAALRWLWAHAWQGADRLRLDVLVDNRRARDFWHSVGFREYCVTMEAGAPGTD